MLETARRETALEHDTAGARSITNGHTKPDIAEGPTQRIRTHFSRCRIRRTCTETAAARATNVHDLMTVLRDHCGPAPRYSPLTGAMAAPCMHAGGLAAASQTTASWVAELTPRGANHWVTATGAPCTGLFKPVRVDEPLDLGPDPTDRFDPTCLWWRHELLHRRCLADPERLLPRFSAERDEIERSWLADPPEPADAFALADRLLERWTEDVRATDAGDTRPPWVRRYWNVRNRRANLPPH